VDPFWRVLPDATAEDEAAHLLGGGQAFTISTGTARPDHPRDQVEGVKVSNGRNGR
jgi:hypothetical protein